MIRFFVGTILACIAFFAVLFTLAMVGMIAVTVNRAPPAAELNLPAPTQYTPPRMR